MNRRQTSGCKEFGVQLVLYLDGELDFDEQRAVETHMEDCRSCRETFKRERWYRERIASAEPLYEAPAHLRSRVADVLSAAQAPLGEGRGALARLLFGHGASRTRYLRRTLAAAATVLLLVPGLWVAMQALDPMRSATFAAVAVDAHQRHQQGRLPLELDTDSPEQISNWFAGKLPFSVQLPDYPEVVGRNKPYRLEGARLVAFRNDYAAYVSYRMGQRPISLVMTSSAVAEPTGKVEIPSANLIFHYETIDGLKVITWSHRGLTYALVSDLEERGQQSCLVCHQDMNDRHLGLLAPLTVNLLE